MKKITDEKSAIFYFVLCLYYYKHFTIKLYSCEFCKARKLEKTELTLLVAKISRVYRNTAERSKYKVLFDFTGYFILLTVLYVLLLKLLFELLAVRGFV